MDASLVVAQAVMLTVGGFLLGLGFHLAGVLVRKIFRVS